MTLVRSTLVDVADRTALGLVLVHVVGRVCRSVIGIALARLIGPVLILVQIFDVGAKRLAFFFRVISHIHKHAVTAKVPADARAVI